MELDIGYEFNVEEAIDKIKGEGVRRVLIQVPEGLKAYATDIVDYLRSIVKGKDLDIDASPAYGSCLIDPSVADRYDVVLHLGHDPYPLWSGGPRNVAYLDLEYVAKDRCELLNRVLEVIMEEENVALYTTNQHKKLSAWIASALKERKVEVEGPYLALGCYVPKPRFKEPYRALVVAGGYFHSLGVGLSLGAEVINADPYTLKVESVKGLVKKFLSVRFYKVSSAVDSRSWGIIVGTSGQYRPELVRRLIKLIEEGGMKYYVFTLPIVSVDAVRSVDSRAIDAFIITSCPRLAIENLAHYEKPVLTPGEGLMAIKKNLSEYVYPW